VGDNLNDIQAMSAADFSIAAFVDASSITAASADALLIKDLSPSSIHGLMKIPYVLELAREVYNTIWKNLVWAMIYNILAVLLSMGVLESYGLSLSS
jgi:cation transport ATPase